MFIYSLIQSMYHMLMGYVWKRSCVAIFFHSTWWIGKWIGISFFIKYLFWIFTAVAEKYNYFIKPHFNFLIFRCFESSIYRGFFRKNWEILFSELVVVHNVSETVIINIYNDWDILASEKHRLRTNQGSSFGFTK